MNSSDLLFSILQHFLRSGDLNKCCTINIWMEKSVPILPDHTLPTFWQSYGTFCHFGLRLALVWCGSADEQRAGRVGWASPWIITSSLRAGSSGIAGPTAGAASISKICIQLFFAKLFKFHYYFWQARSRLYQNEIFEANMSLAAFFKLYKMCTLFAPLQIQHFSKKSV